MAEQGKIRCAKCGTPIEVIEHKLTCIKEGCINNKFKDEPIFKIVNETDEKEYKSVVFAIPPNNECEFQQARTSDEMYKKAIEILGGVDEVRFLPMPSELHCYYVKHKNKINPMEMVVNHIPKKEK